MKPIVEVKSFTKKYGDFVAVNDISFEVEEGTIFAFLGPNGAGKSTAINPLARYLNFRIKSSIEEEMQNMGIMKAVGYISKQVLISVAFPYILLAPIFIPIGIFGS